MSVSKYTLIYSLRKKRDVYIDCITLLLIEINIRISKRLKRIKENNSGEILSD